METVILIYLLLGMQYLQKMKVKPWFFFIKHPVELITSIEWL